MVGERKNKGKELAGNRHRLSVRTPTFCPINDDCTKRPSPTLIVFSPTSDSSTQQPFDADIETPVIIKTNIEGGDRIFIHPRGQEFTYHTKCARLIEKIIELKFNEPWKSFKNVPVDIKDTLFGEFEKEFSWCEEDRRQIRKIFETVCSDVMKNRLFEAKKSNKRPIWISQRIWNALQKEWESEQDKKVCEQNKKNHAVDCDRQDYPKHKENGGHEPTVAEDLMHTHSRLKLEGGERVLADEQSHITHGEYVAEHESEVDVVGSSEAPAPLQLQIERWAAMEGGKKKGRVYGLAGLANQISSGASSSARTDRERQLQSELDLVQEKLSNMQEKLDRFDAMEARVTQLEHLQSQMAAFEAMTAKMAAFEQTQAQMVAFMRTTQQHQGEPSSFAPTPTVDLPVPSTVAPMPRLPSRRQQPRGITLTVSTPFGPPVPHVPMIVRTVMLSD